MKNCRIAVIPGDGIGIEVMPAMSRRVQTRDAGKAIADGVSRVSIR